MSESSDKGIKLILAAGGLLWRKSGPERQVLLIHRQQYDDWTLPKGKLEKGESWEEAALREVEEETGCPASIDNFAGILSYAPDGQPKAVLYFNMTPTAKCRDIPMGSGSEVDACRWVTVPEAAQLLTYDAERDLLLSA